MRKDIWINYTSRLKKNVQVMHTEFQAIWPKHDSIMRCGHKNKGCTTKCWCSSVASMRGICTVTGALAFALLIQMEMKPSLPEHP